MSTTLPVAPAAPAVAASAKPAGTKPAGSPFSEVLASSERDPGAGEEAPAPAAEAAEKPADTKADAEPLAAVEPAGAPLCLPQAEVAAAMLPLATLMAWPAWMVSSAPAPGLPAAAATETVQDAAKEVDTLAHAPLRAAQLPTQLLAAGASHPAANSAAQAQSPETMSLAAVASLPANPLLESNVRSDFEGTLAPMLALVQRTEPTALPAGLGQGVLNASAGALVAENAVRHATAPARIELPLTHAQWGDAFSSRVAVMVQTQMTEASIQVTPPELGPIEVKLQFEGNRVHAQFGAAQGEAREAIQGGIPRLREMLAGEGLNLGQTFVGHQHQNAATAHDRSGTSGGFPGFESNVESDGPSVPISMPVRIGLLDEFA